MNKNNSLRTFHLMAKPTGSICNLACKYCFYTCKESLYPHSHFRMKDQLLESYIRQLIESQQTNEITISWQGGEPTLMGLDFFRRSIEIQRRYIKSHMRIRNTFQTNGVLLDDEWCEFLHKHNFLVGLSLDGPQKNHDVYRKDKHGNPTFERVIQGARLLRKYKVDFNVLTAVHAANVRYPLEVYCYLRDEAGAQYIQFIPIVEIEKNKGGRNVQSASVRSVGAKLYGRFLITIFDEWIRNDVGRIFVQSFDVALGNWIGAPPSLCIFSPECGLAPVMEHNGDVYVCDHFVEEKYLLGNISHTPLIEIIASDILRKFGRDKQDRLPQYCRNCEVLFACNGECPKNRFLQTKDGEAGLNYLCQGYKAFFYHIDRPMRIMANLLKRNEAPAEIMQLLHEEDLKRAFAKAKRNEPCPCSSGKKFKHCHGKLKI
jgi:uncharacterized protein